MQINKITKIIICSILITCTNIFTAYFVLKKEKFDNFLLNIGYDMNILKILDQNRTETAKNLLTNSIRGVYYTIAQTENIESYKPVCKYLTHDNFKILDKYEKNQTYNYNSKDKKLLELGKNRILDLCKIQDIENIEQNRE